MLINLSKALNTIRHKNSTLVSAEVDQLFCQVVKKLRLICSWQQQG